MLLHSNVTVLKVFIYFFDRNKQTKSKTYDRFATNVFAMLNNVKER